MNEDYEIRFWQDKEWAIYRKGSSFNSDFLFRGTLEEVNAWLSLREKGFDLLE